MDPNSSKHKEDDKANNSESNLSSHNTEGIIDDIEREAFEIFQSCKQKVLAELECTMELLKGDDTSDSDKIDLEPLGEKDLFNQPSSIITTTDKANDDSNIKYCGKVCISDEESLIQNEGIIVSCNPITVTEQLSVVSTVNITSRGLHNINFNQIVVTSMPQDYSETSENDENLITEDTNIIRNKIYENVCDSVSEDIHNFDDDVQRAAVSSISSESYKVFSQAIVILDFLKRKSSMMDGESSSLEYEPPWYKDINKIFVNNGSTSSATDNASSTCLEEFDNRVNTQSVEFKFKIQPVNIEVQRQRVYATKRDYIIQEIKSTEKIYVTELESVIEGYINEIYKPENKMLVPLRLELNVDIIFGNWIDIFEFHNNVICKELEEAGNNFTYIAAVFVDQKDSLFKLYSTYCKNYPRSDRLKDTLKEAEIFLNFCRENTGHSLPLSAYLLKPIQRLTKYQLFLQDLYRYCNEKETAPMLKEAIDTIIKVLKCVNENMLQTTIIGFPFDLSFQGSLLLQGTFFISCDYKKDSKYRTRYMEKHIFLYEKTMLICKVNRKRVTMNSLFTVKYFLSMSTVGLTENVLGDEKKFEVWLEGRNAVFTITTNSEEEKKQWVWQIKDILGRQLSKLKEDSAKDGIKISNEELDHTASMTSSTRYEVRENSINVGSVSSDEEEYGSSKLSRSLKGFKNKSFGRLAKLFNNGSKNSAPTP